jgi:hypothetical protein
LAFWQQQAPSGLLQQLLLGLLAASGTATHVVQSVQVLLDHGNCLQQQTRQPNSTMVTIPAGAHHVPSQSLPPQQNQADQFFSRQAYGLGMGCLATVFTPQAFITTSRQ